MILPGLIIGYFLLITNPPPALLQYDANLKMAVTHHLSGAEIINHFSSISIFIVTFFLISTFLVFVIVRMFSETKVKFIPANATLIIFSIIVLGLIAYPYYGPKLTVILYFDGLIGALAGIVLFDPIRSRCLSFFSISALALFFCMWILTDLQPSVVWFLGMLILAVIALFFERRRKLKLYKKRKRARKRPST